MWMRLSESQTILRFCTVTLNICVRVTSSHFHFCRFELDHFLHYLLCFSSPLSSSPPSSSSSFPPPSSSPCQGKLEPKASTFQTFNATRSFLSLSLPLSTYVARSHTNTQESVCLPLSLSLSKAPSLTLSYSYSQESASASLAPLLPSPSLPACNVTEAEFTGSKTEQWRRQESPTPSCFVFSFKVQLLANFMGKL